MTFAHYDSRLRGYLPEATEGELPWSVAIREQDTLPLP